jgi:hypothetical protein
MKTILNPKFLIPIVVTLLLASTVGYILLAPDTWWKPIYIQYTDEASANSGTAEAVTPESQPAAITPPGEVASGPGNIVPQLVMPAIQPGQGVMYQLEPKVVNLAEPGGLRYLQAGIVLEFHPTVKEYYLAKTSGEGATTSHSSEAAAATPADAFQAAIDSMRPVIDDIVTTDLSSKTFNEIATIEGKQALKQELIGKINAALGYQGVINIYFTEFIVQ